MEDRQLNNLQELWIVWKWFRAVVRWLSIVIFGVLFFIALYFKMPWKVLVCLAVIPVVGMFVPRKIQSWIWLTLSVFLISLYGWLHLPEKNSSLWKPYQFGQDLSALENQSPLTGPNAADLYKQVLDEYGETIFYFSFRDELEEQQTLTQPWNPDEHPRLDFWISIVGPATDKLVRASAIDQCRFDIPHTIPSLDPQMARLNQLKGWVRLLLRASNRDLYKGLTEEALQKQLAVIGLARHLYQQKTLRDQAAAFDIELLGARALEACLIDRITDTAQLDRIAQAFSAIDPRWSTNWPHILAREKLQSKNLMGLFYEVNDKGRVRFSHSAMMALQEGLGYRPRRLFINQQTMNRLAVIGLWLFLPSNPERIGDLVDRRFDYYSLQAQQNVEFRPISLRHIWVLGLNVQSLVDWLAMERVGYYWAFNGQFTRHEALSKRIALFSAIKQYRLTHNRWPEKLDDLPIDRSWFIDPLNQQPFHYQASDSGFILYSLGPNGMDDGGQYEAESNKDDIQIWPPKSRPAADETQ